MDRHNQEAFNARAYALLQVLCDQDGGGRATPRRQHMLDELADLLGGAGQGLERERLVAFLRDPLPIPQPVTWLSPTAARMEREAEAPDLEAMAAEALRRLDAHPARTHEEMLQRCRDALASNAGQIAELERIAALERGERR